jgi:hypothetical protein
VPFLFIINCRALCPPFFFSCFYILIFYCTT